MFNNHIHIQSVHGNYYIYDVFQKAFHISNALIYDLAGLCRENSWDIRHIPGKYKKEFAERKGITIRELNRQIRLFGELHPISDTQTVKPISFNPMSREDLEESLANVERIALEVTEKCNLACRYCCYRELYSDSAEAQRKNNMDTDTCFHVLDKIIRMQQSKLVRSVDKELVIAFYGGECLANFELIKKVVAYTSPYNTNSYHIKYRMTTNGILLDKHIEFLVANNFHLAISLDGNEDNNGYRVFPDGTPSFPVVYKNICDIRDKYPDFFDKNISFLSVQHKLNSAHSIYMFFKQFGKKPLISPLVTESIDVEHLEEFRVIAEKKPISSVQLNEIKAQIPAVYREVFSSTHYLESLFPKQMNTTDLFNQEIKYNFIINSSCFLFKSKLFLTATGEIYLCEKSSREFPFGKAEGKKITFYTDKINAYYRRMINNMNKHCLDCYQLNDCGYCFFSEPSKFTGKKTCKIGYQQLAAYLTSLINENEQQ